jgi:hypothetical protein
VLTAYEEHRAPVRNKEDNNNRILTHDGDISPTIIPTGHVGNESTESSLHKLFFSCELLRGKDIGELPPLFRDILNDIYEDRILNTDNDFQPPDVIINSLVACISTTDMQNEINITMGPTDLMYLIEFSRIH